MVLIIYCHPSLNSHNGKILTKVTSVLKKHHRKHQIIDLYKENFSGAFSAQEYQRMRQRDRTLDADIEKYQQKIKSAQHLIFIYPTWWYNMPALLKGFMDRVFTNGFAYRFKKVNRFLLLGAWLLSFIPGLRYLAQPYSAQGFLKDKKATIFRTYGGPKLGKRIFGNTPTVLENVVLRFCGLKKIRVYELFNIDKKSFTQTQEDQFLKKVAAVCSKI